MVIADGFSETYKLHKEFNSIHWVHLYDIFQWSILSYLDLFSTFNTRGSVSTRSVLGKKEILHLKRNEVVWISIKTEIEAVAKKKKKKKKTFSRKRYWKQLKFNSDFFFLLLSIFDKAEELAEWFCVVPATLHKFIFLCFFFFFFQVVVGVFFRFVFILFQCYPCTSER